MNNEVMEKHLLDLTNQVSSMVESSNRFIRVLESTSSGNTRSSDRKQTDAVDICVLPYFDGTDPEGWIYKAELYFKIYETPPLQQVKTAAFHLDGKALQWYKWMKSVEPIQSWVGFSIALLKRFGKNHYDELVAPITKLNQGGSSEDYKEEFIEPTNIVEEMVSEEFVADPINSEVVIDSSILSEENQDKSLDTELISSFFFDEEDFIRINQQEGKPTTELGNSIGISCSQLAASKMVLRYNKHIQFTIEVENFEYLKAISSNSVKLICKKCFSLPHGYTRKLFDRGKGLVIGRYPSCVKNSSTFCLNLLNSCLIVYDGSIIPTVDYDGIYVSVMINKHGFRLDSLYMNLILLVLFKMGGYNDSGKMFVEMSQRGNMKLLDQWHDTLREESLWVQLQVELLDEAILHLISFRVLSQSARFEVVHKFGSFACLTIILQVLFELHWWDLFHRVSFFYVHHGPWFGQFVRAYCTSVRDISLQMAEVLSSECVNVFAWIVETQVLLMVIHILDILMLVDYLRWKFKLPTSRNYESLAIREEIKKVHLNSAKLVLKFFCYAQHDTYPWAWIWSFNIAGSFYLLFDLTRSLFDRGKKIGLTLGNSWFPKFYSEFGSQFDVCLNLLDRYYSEPVQELIYRHGYWSDLGCNGVSSIAWQMFGKMLNRVIQNWIVVMQQLPQMYEAKNYCYPCLDCTSRIFDRGKAQEWFLYHGVCKVQLRASSYHVLLLLDVVYFDPILKEACIPNKVNDLKQITYEYVVSLNSAYCRMLFDRGKIGETMLCNSHSMILDATYAILSMGELFRVVVDRQKGDVLQILLNGFKFLLAPTTPVPRISKTRFYFSTTGCFLHFYLLTYDAFESLSTREKVTMNILYSSWKFKFFSTGLWSGRSINTAVHLSVFGMRVNWTYTSTVFCKVTIHHQLDFLLQLKMSKMSYKLIFDEGLLVTIKSVRRIYDRGKMFDSVKGCTFSVSEWAREGAANTVRGVQVCSDSSFGSHKCEKSLLSYVRLTILICEKALNRSLHSDWISLRTFYSTPYLTSCFHERIDTYKVISIAFRWMVRLRWKLVATMDFKYINT